jgi:hypothetical protein
MKKLWLLVGILLLTAGCEATYTIRLDSNSINEKIEIIEENNKISISDVSKELDSIIVSNADETTETGFYTFNKIIGPTKSGLDISYLFEPAVKYKLYSPFLKYCYDDVTFVYDAMKANLSTNSNIKCFDFFAGLDKITLNIVSNYEVTRHNANSVDGNTYTWIINKNDSGKISLEVDKQKIIKENESIIDEPRVQFVIIVVLFILLPSILILYVYFKYLQYNKI